MSKSLYNYQKIESGQDFDEKSSLAFFGTREPPVLDYTMDEMEALAKKVVESSVAVPGVQPKLSLGFIKDVLNNTPGGRLTVVGALGGNYILKPPNKLFPGMPENEHLTMKMAEACGIAVVPSSLIRLKSGELSFITKRIDRTENGEKIHMLDMFQILEAFDKYRGSLEKVGKAIAEHSSNTLLDLVRFFEVTIFCYITGNNDMHLKKFSLIKRNENWELSPAYDLLNVHLHLPEDAEETALTIVGKMEKLTQEDFLNFGVKIGLSEKQINNTFQRLVKNKSKMLSLIQQSVLATEIQEKYHQFLFNRITFF